MNINAFIHFDGKCREAVALYARIFNAKKVKIRLYGELPENAGQLLAEKDKERVAFASMKVKGGMLLFADYPAGKKAPKGGNIDIMLVVESGKKVDTIYAKLVEGGKGELEPQKTSWTKRYAVLTDRFGVRWHLARKSRKLRG